ncbi:hypothetical protein CBR_g53498 [Chara braunii]|uniref:N-acetyltransferase ESCO acetyl-transferase domain-containing protein n=1 Tax=Chara braunii TaxID=69332 RepID=A0A388MAT4_CHABU|nr:hypothetical protein CBR_g53498 [Chara braunii]|eukprot:GBG91684.1 hypothetical protein CBR_g53498 [Chara braunii]
MNLRMGMMAGRKRDMNWMGLDQSESAKKRMQATAALRQSDLRHLGNVNKEQGAKNRCHDIDGPQGVNYEEQGGAKRAAENGIERSIEGRMMDCVEEEERKDDQLKADESSSNREAITRYVRGDFHDRVVHHYSLEIGEGHEEDRLEGPAAAANGWHGRDDSTPRSAKEAGCCCEEREGGGGQDNTVHYSLKIGKGREEDHREGPAAANGCRDRDDGTTRLAKRTGCCCNDREAKGDGLADQDGNRYPMFVGGCTSLRCSFADTSQSGHIDDRSAEEAQEGTSYAEHRERGRGLEMVAMKSRCDRDGHLQSAANWYGGSMFRKLGSSGSMSKTSYTHRDRDRRLQGRKVMRSLVCSDTSVKAVCGVRAIWVWARARRKGIASKLLDAARASFCFGYVIKPSEIAFTQPTYDGQALAIRYCQTESFLVYK